MRRQNADSPVANELLVLHAAFMLLERDVDKFYVGDITPLVPAEASTVARSLKWLVTAGLLERAGWFEGEKQRPRLYYRLTPEGQSQASSKETLVVVLKSMDPSEDELLRLIKLLLSIRNSS